MIYSLSRRYKEAEKKIKLYSGQKNYEKII